MLSVEPIDVSDEAHGASLDADAACFAVDDAGFARQECDKGAAKDRIGTPSQELLLGRVECLHVPKAFAAAEEYAERDRKTLVQIMAQGIDLARIVRTVKARPEMRFFSSAQHPFSGCDCPGGAADGR
jgi:hypothetical protein